ncbi:MAG: ABC-2 family transporter protein [Chloroflexi bacterium ADurb.Bin180]|nr:MAG: ABC-2 family transporter protein [Chloroflexi bacterium ADurb.Bin180]HNR97202.1 ABC transporter permease subunit [Anaerolineae bacterium]HNT06203.1 ABC transporter permease subunit [Anaerolineae bacterium]
MNKIRTIIAKEWAEVFQNRMVVFSVIFMPLMFAGLPLLMLYTMRGSTGMADSAGIPSSLLRGCAEGLTVAECMQVYFVTQFMMLFMLTPLIVPVNIAAYSIAGEKTTRSLEPLLATPITTAELLAGKNLAAVIPAVLATWLSFALFGLGARLLVGNAKVLTALLDPMWWLAILVVGPLLSVLSTNFALMVSSRVNDPRVAEQLSALIMLPLLVLFFGQIAGFIYLNTRLMLVLAVAMVAVDALMVLLATQVFQREAILTRWK